MRAYYLLTVFTLFIFSILAQDDTRKLIYVQEVVRHGSRYPLYPNPKDNSDLPGIENLNAQLTIQGMSQHYLLGQQLYKNYWQQLFGKNNNKYRQQKFYFKSTDVNRTLQSLQAQLLGLFQTTDRLKIDDSEIPFSLPAWNATFERKSGDLYERSPFFHPFPIHVEKDQNTPWTQGDFLKTYDSCYKQGDWMKANKQDPYAINITQNPNLTRAVAALSQVLNETISFYDIDRYYDSAICLIYLAKQPLAIFKPDTEFSRDLAKIYTLQAYIRNFYNEEQIRTITTPYFNQTVNHFKRVAANQQGVQWVIHSAHDTNIEFYLVRLGMASAQCIYQNYLNNTKTSEYCVVEASGFASQIIFELYQYPNQTTTFQIRYNGNYRRIPFCSYQYECDVNVFYQWYDSWKNQDWIKTCGVKNHTSETYFSIIIIELGVIIIFAVAAVLRYLNSKKPEVNQAGKVEAEGNQGERQSQPALQESLISQQNELA